ncbi:hypothetical protein U1Q18_036845, partial [Sarracenia purpurea var. burkii]
QLPEIDTGGAIRSLLRQSNYEKSTPEEQSEAFGMRTVPPSQSPNPTPSPASRPGLRDACSLVLAEP